MRYVESHEGIKRVIFTAHAYVTRRHSQGRGAPRVCTLVLHFDRHCGCVAMMICIEVFLVYKCCVHSTVPCIRLSLTLSFVSHLIPVILHVLPLSSSLFCCSLLIITSTCSLVPRPLRAKRVWTNVYRAHVMLACQKIAIPQASF